MYDTFSKPYVDFFNSTKDIISNFPKSPTDAEEFLKKLKAVFEAQTESVKKMWSIYASAARGDASPNQIVEANKIAADLANSVRFATITMIPGSVFFLPQMISFAKEYGIDLVPSAVAKEFTFA